MNIELAQGSVAAVDKFVWLSGADDEDVAGDGLSLLIANFPFGAPFHDVYHLVVIVFVQARSLAGLADNHEERDADAAMILPHELMRHADKRELRLMDGIHGLFDSHRQRIDSQVLWQSWPTGPTLPVVPGVAQPSILGFTDSLLGCTLDYVVISLPAGGGHACGSGRSHLG
jgi:hypothetical protein